MRNLLIDNFDSFTYNLVHLMGDEAGEIDVVRNNEIDVATILERQYDSVVLSPGPCTPNEAGVCLDVVKHISGVIPILGVCLGHQTIGQAFGGDVVRAAQCVHGQTSEITHNSKLLFEGLESPLRVTRYHSLVVQRETFPDTLDILAQSDDGLVMALAHKTLPVFGVQFHPESIATQNGKRMMDNFLNIARAFRNS